MLAKNIIKTIVNFLAHPTLKLLAPYVVQYIQQQFDIKLLTTENFTPPQKEITEKQIYPLGFIILLVTVSLSLILIALFILWLSESKKNIIAAMILLSSGLAALKDIYIYCLGFSQIVDYTQEVKQFLKQDQ